MIFFPLQNFVKVVLLKYLKICKNHVKKACTYVKGRVDLLLTLVDLKNAEIEYYWISVEHFS